METLLKIWCTRSQTVLVASHLKRMATILMSNENISKKCHQWIVAAHVCTAVKMPSNDAGKHACDSNKSRQPKHLNSRIEKKVIKMFSLVYTHVACKEIRVFIQTTSDYWKSEWITLLLQAITFIESVRIEIKLNNRSRNASFDSHTKILQPNKKHDKWVLTLGIIRRQLWWQTSYLLALGIVCAVGNALIETAEKEFLTFEALTRA